jgi:hypothetical protein
LPYLKLKDARLHKEACLLGQILQEHGGIGKPGRNAWALRLQLLDLAGQVVYSRAIGAAIDNTQQDVAACYRRTEIQRVQAGLHLSVDRRPQRDNWGIDQSPDARGLQSRLERREADDCHDPQAERRLR